MAKLKKKKLQNETDDQFDLRLGQAIVDVWKNVPIGTRHVERLDLIAAIRDFIRNSDNQGKRYAFDVIVDPIEANNEKFAFITIPAPDLQGSEEIRAWATRHFDTDDKVRELGKAVLYGCGR